MVDAKEISFKAGSKEILHSNSVSFMPGTFNVIMGANGAGKSTLLKLLAGSQKPVSGSITIAGKNINAYSHQQLAQRRAILSQQYAIGFPITAREVVMMGRYPYFTLKPSKKDEEICDEAIEQMGMTAFAARDYNTLSGGEAQKIQMCRVLAQINTQGNSPILFLDEPVSHLDIKYQHQLLRIAKDCCARSVTVIAVLHDINLSLQYADRILLMKEGAVIHDTTEMSTLTPTVIRHAFDIEASVFQPEGYSRPLVVF